MNIHELYSLIRKTILIVGVFMLMRGQTHAQCAAVTPEYMAESASASKCGYTENYPYISSPPKYYLKSHYIETGYGTFYYYGNNGCTFLYENVIGSYYKTFINSWDYLYCTNYPAVCSGNAAYHSIYEFTEGCMPPETPVIYNDNYAATINSDGTVVETDGGDAFDDVGDIAWGINWVESGADVSCPVDTSQTTSVLWGQQTSCTAISEEDGSTWSGQHSETTTLENEFTDSLLRSKVIYFIPPFPDPPVWVTNYANSFGSAFYSLNSSHDTAGAGRMKYRFHVTDCQPHTSYLVTWDEVTTYQDNSQTASVQHLQEEVEGTGDPAGLYTSVHERDVPSVPSTIVVNNVNVTYSPWDLPGF